MTPPKQWYRKYRVLERLEESKLYPDEQLFVHVADVVARNADHAKRLAAEQLVAPEPRRALLWAIPDRNWNEEEIPVQTVIKVG